MSEALPEGPAVPGSEARSPVVPPVQGTAPAWNPAEHPESSDPSLHTEEPNVARESPERTAMTGTAEAIGSVVGTAQRQWRRGLELVRRPATRPLSEAEAIERANELAREESELARQETEPRSRVVDPDMLKEIETEVSNARRQAARRLDEWSEIAEDRFQQFRQQVRNSLHSSRERVRKFADVYPLQTIALIAGVSFALGMTLRFRRSHRG